MANEKDQPHDERMKQPERDDAQREVPAEKPDRIADDDAPSDQARYEN